MASTNLQVSLSFLDWQPLYETERPFQIFINIPPNAQDQRDTNLVFKRVPVTIHDVRSLPPSNFSLDTNGFIYRNHVFNDKATDFTNRASVEQTYLPEVEQFLRREVEGVDRVFFFDWRLRKNAPEIEGTEVDLNDFTAWLRPAVHVHVDQSPAAALKRIQLQLPNDAPSLLQGRVRIINIWRPLLPTPHTVIDWPLALCDGSTINPRHLVEADHVRQHYTGSTMYLLPDPEPEGRRQRRWYYMSQQSKDDVVIFKNFDSRRDVRAKYAPHASFLHPHHTETADAEPRQSIEVRAFVFTYPPPPPPGDSDLSSREAGG